MECRKRKKLESGTRVKIISNTSKFKGMYGTVEGYCCGRCSTICRVKVDGKGIINICDFSLAPEEKAGVNIVTVRWFDSYLEEFEATEVRFGSDILFLRLVDGKNRHIPLRQVRWFGMTEESHQREVAK